MANVLSPYNPTFYAAEALILVQNALGMANRVYRGYEAERAGYGLGETILVPVSLMNISNPRLMLSQMTWILSLHHFILIFLGSLVLILLQMQ
jgi:hypothetical protein